MQRPRVGVGVFVNKDGKILLAKEKDLTAPVPGLCPVGTWNLGSHSKHVASERSLKRQD